MIRRIYSIRDAKAEYYCMPFFNSTHGEAERNFQMAMTDEKTTLSKHPEDYDLYYLGMFNDQSGKFDAVKTPEHVIKGIESIAQNNSRNGLQNAVLQQTAHAD